MTVIFFALTLAGKISDAAPAGYLPIDLAGMEKFIAESHGKMIVVNFFASWCPPCREEIPGLIALRKFFPENKLALIGVSVDEDMNALKNYAQKARFNYPIRMAMPDLLRGARISSIPHLCIFDKQGKLLVNIAGIVPEKVLRDFLREHLEK